jgi:iron complex transport system substrate-binding protein
MIGRKQIVILGCLLMIGLAGLCGCGSPSSDSMEPVESEAKGETKADSLGNLKYKSSMELQYAKNFSVDDYEGGYKILKTMDGTQILVVPEEKEVPDGISKDVVVVKQPVKNLYVVSSSIMDIFSKLDAMDAIRLSSQKEEDWYVQDAKDAMERGDILYAGKYSKPDYELIVSENCSLAIENTMITHSPEVSEMLADFDIPTMIEYSSYESHPLGRVEWVKFFGALIGKDELAQKIFDEEVRLVDEVTSVEKTDKTVAFFYVTSNGLIQVRSSSDYVPKMINLAGGNYIPTNIGDPDSKRSTVSMQIEDFYDQAKDVDFIIYNSSIDGGIGSVQELLDKCAVLKDFKAVKEGNVWCTTNDMYQQSMSIGYLIHDMHAMLQGKDQDEMTYLFHVE